MEAIDAHRAKVFCLSRQDLTAAQQVRRFLDNMNRIVQRSQKPGPYIYIVYEDKVTKRHP